MTWTLDIVDVGTIPALPLGLFLPDAPADATIDVPCFAYLLTAPGRTVLVDTGPDVEVARRAGFGPTGDAVGALRTALASRGRKGADVETVVHTHLHYDHAQNHAEFPSATVIVQARELEWACDGGGDGFVLDADRLVASLGDRLRPVDGDAEPAPGLRLLLTGGHTPGHQVLVVETDVGEVCIAADVVPLAANRSIVAPNCLDRAAVERFLATAAAAGWLLLPGHDPHVRAALTAGRPWSSIAGAGGAGSSELKASDTDREE
ncbi:MAG TPA: N-acyl homoserine lactonase family protein [Gaiellaceae bacterium]|jgi:glyoxylase-like metal-dependent hydrolase (beta-lactamase superfamily II)